MTAEQYAPAVMQAGIDLGITPKGIVIGFATVFVESNWQNYANAKVPDSMNIPHDAVGSDGYSVGLFQQQVVGPPWWWGDAATCMDPYKSAQLFFGRLAKFDYNGDGQTPGGYAQSVQQSAFPDRYDQRMSDAQDLYNQLAQGTAPMPAPIPASIVAAAPAFNYKDWTARCPNHQDRDGTRIDLVLLHTQEPGCAPDAPDIVTAEDLANFLINSADTGNPVSYHRTLDNTVTVIDVVQMSQASWSVMNSNDRSINMCFAGSEVAWNRDEWLANMGNAIDVAAYLAVLDCHAWGIPLTVVPGPNYNADPPCISDHRYCSDYLQDGNNHVDVGDNFPWDVFDAAVAKYGGRPAPAPAPEPPAPPAPTPGTTYVIQPGDTLDGIAEQFGVTEDALLAANPSITNPDFIEAGQTITIP